MHVRNWLYYESDIYIANMEPGYIASYCLARLLLNGLLL